MVRGQSSSFSSGQGSQARNRGATIGPRPPAVAEGAEETRLFDTQGRAALEDAKKLGPSLKSQETSYSSSSYEQASRSREEVSSSGGAASTGGGQDYVYSGWRMLPNGTYIRVYDSKQSSASSTMSSSGGGQRGQSSSASASGSLGGQVDAIDASYSGTGRGRTTATSSQSGRSSSSYESGLAGGGSGSSSRISSSSVQRESVEDSAVSSEGGADKGWIKLPDGTWTRQSSYSSSSSSRGFSTSGGSGAANSGTISSGSGTQGSRSSGTSYSGSNYAGASGSLGGREGSSLDVLMSAAQGPGDYHGTMSRAELEREAGGPIFSARGGETRQQVVNTRYQGEEEEEEEEERRHEEDEQEERYNTAGGSSTYSGEGEDYVTTTGGKWVWSEVNKKWEWEAASATSYGGQLSPQTEESGSTDSGWTILPNGTYVKQVSAWSRTSSSSNQQGGEAAGGRQGYFETGSIVGRNSAASGASLGGGNSGSTSSGWTLLANGTYVRRQQQSSSNAWSGSDSRRGGSSSSDLGTGSVLSPSEFGDQGSNTTGWVRQADGTMVRKSSSWASWSSTNFEEVDGDRLEDIQQQLNERARSNIRRLPANVEPGFEDQYVRKHRSLNSR
jgi:hypothetical protein